MKKKLRLIAVMLITVIVFACSSEPENFTLTVKKVGEGEITITPQNDIYEKDAKVTITAVPSDGWKFKEWSGDASGTAESIKVTMDKNKTITATFVEKEKYTLTTNVSPTGAGTVTLNPPTGPYEKGSTVTVTAVAGDNHLFDNWSGDLSGSTNPTSIVMDKNKTITATFAEKARYTLTTTVSPTGKGNITTNPPTGPYYDGSTITVTAVAVANYVFGSWGGDLSGSTNPTSVVMDENKAITATFAEKARYTLTTAVSPTGAGTITLNPPTGPYYDGSTVTVTAVDGADHVFDSWSGNLTGSTNPASVVMDENKTITANFLPTYNLNTSTTGLGTGNIILTPPTGPYKKGTTVDVEACAEEGSAFKEWGGNLSGSTNPTSIVMDSDKTISAEFAEVVTLTVSTEGMGSVVVDPEKDVYAKGDVVNLEAVPALNISTFTKWEGGTIDNSTNATETITLNGDTTVKAIFGLRDKVSFYEDFEQNNGSWSTKYTYSLLSSTDNDDDNPFVQQTTVYDGDWAAQFGSVDDNEYNYFKTDVNLAQDSYVSFLYKVSSEEDYDKFYFLVDSYNPADAELVDSGDVDWTKYETELATGNHTLLWVYKKDVSGSGGEDTAWVDDIMIREAVPKHTLTINTTGYGHVVKKVDGEISYLKEYEEGKRITLEAVPGPDESFITWGGAGAPAGHLTDSTIEITMGTSDMTIDASFTGTAPAIEWLIMMYVGGDCDLEKYLWSDLNEMEVGLYKLDEDVRNNIKVVALWDGNPGETDPDTGYSSIPPEGARLYELGPDSELNMAVSGETLDKTAEKWWTGDEVDMSDGATVTSFLNWAKENYPGCEHTMLMLSDHGGGPRSRNGKPKGRGAVWDETTGGFGSFLETKELSQAISNAGFNGDHKLSLLGFDACLMASVEEAYEHRIAADYYVASLQTEQGDGWEYDHWIPQIISGMSPAELGTLLVKSYHDNFDALSWSDQTLSCTDLSKMDDLKTTLDALGKAIKDNNLVASCKATFTSEDSVLFDGTWGKLYEVGDFVSRLSSTAVSTEASAVADAMKEAIVYSWADTEKGDYYGAGSVTGRGLHLMGSTNYSFDYSTNIFSFADGDWAALYNEWYP